MGVSSRQGRVGGRALTFLNIRLTLEGVPYEPSPPAVCRSEHSPMSASAATNHLWATCYTRFGLKDRGDPSGGSGRTDFAGDPRGHVRCNKVPFSKGGAWALMQRNGSYLMNFGTLE